ncbi:sulfite exporter TauE/SafE family protein [Shewanella cyperi]|uniref:Sulfite exporter TauE/SafE family protein n=1 Tax=Shewanella cyperi TaxID=2814292 RepID=A0A975ALP3_9GAMM|nr:sulfite exporter TauE/SafE family protein [Shewanella cyperi]QSX31662.1 sulfite exporter TauE/SafE family protein [Shewanella cyperi]
MMEYGVAAAFFVGLMGGGHCLGMCGGLTGAFSAQIPAPAPGENHLAHRLGFLFSYNFGRIFSYSLAGLLCGALVSGLDTLLQAKHFLLMMRLVAGTMMILLGLYIARIWHGLLRLEKLGKLLWRWLQPLSRPLLPINRRSKAFFAGMIWGWLPCGLVYSTLTWSVASADPLQGMLIMLFFGLGTLPVMLSSGFAASSLSSWLQKRSIRLIFGIILMVFGLQTLYIGLSQLG